ncbi:MAG: hypothetical protein M1837_000010 [Sclerophora amabilis]|nr:MAG: hypothetical protein M1837_000010 [Sclerophora amabilis]
MDVKLPTKPKMARKCEVTLVSHDLFDEITKRTLHLVPNGSSLKIGRSSRNDTKGLIAAYDNAWVSSPVMSREHAELWAEPTSSTTPERLYLKDLRSMHGTWVNGVRLEPNTRQSLVTGDTVKFGSEVVRGAETFRPCSFSVEVRMLEPERAANQSSGTFAVPELDSDDETDYDVDAYVDDEGDYSESAYTPPSSVTRADKVEPTPASTSCPGKDISEDRSSDEYEPQPSLPQRGSSACRQEGEILETRSSSKQKMVDVVEEYPIDDQPRPSQEPTSPLEQRSDPPNVHRSSEADSNAPQDQKVEPHSALATGAGSIKNPIDLSDDRGNLRSEIILDSDDEEPEEEPIRPITDFAPGPYMSKQEAGSLAFHGFFEDSPSNAGSSSGGSSGDDEKLDEVEVETKADSGSAKYRIDEELGNEMSKIPELDGRPELDSGVNPSEGAPSIIKDSQPKAGDHRSLSGHATTSHGTTSNIFDRLDVDKFDSTEGRPLERAPSPSDAAMPKAPPFSKSSDSIEALQLFGRQVSSDIHRDLDAIRNGRVTTFEERIRDSEYPLSTSASSERLLQRAYAPVEPSIAGPEPPQSFVDHLGSHFIGHDAMGGTPPTFNQGMTRSTFDESVCDLEPLHYQPWASQSPCFRSAISPEGPVHAHSYAPYGRSWGSMPAEDISEPRANPLEAHDSEDGALRSVLTGSKRKAEEEPVSVSESDHVTHCSQPEYSGTIPEDNDFPDAQPWDATVPSTQPPSLEMIGPAATAHGTTNDVRHSQESRSTKRAKTAATTPPSVDPPSRKRVKTAAKTAAQAITFAVVGAAGLFAALVATCPPD